MKAPAGLVASLLGAAAALVTIVTGSSAIGADPGLPTNPNLPSHAVEYGYDAPVDVALGRTVEPGVSEMCSFASESTVTAAERPAGDNYDSGFDLVAPRPGAGLNLPFANDALRAQVDDVVRHFDEFGTPPQGVAPGGLKGHPAGTYGNKGGELPSQPLGYYTEMDVWPSQGVGTGTRGTERLVFGDGGEIFYSRTHYYDFVRIR